MLPSTYISESLKTEARDFTPVIERFKDPALAALTCQLLSNITDLSQALDKVKKNIYYGKEVEGIADDKAQALQQASKGGVLNALFDIKNSITSDVKNIRLLHSIIGMTSEVGEMVTCFMEAMAEGKEMDVTNFKEESGDFSWYQSIGLDAIGSSYEEIWQMNRDKLAKRYSGQKFTEEQAVTRNLDAERKTLEGTF